MRVWRFSDAQRQKLEKFGRSVNEIEGLERRLPDAANDLAGEATKSEILAQLKSIKVATHTLKNRLDELIRSTDEGWSSPAWNAFGYLENAEDRLTNEAEDRELAELRDLQPTPYEESEVIDDFIIPEKNNLIFEDMLEAILAHTKRLDPICDRALEDVKKEERSYNRKDRALFWIENALERKISGSKSDIETVCVVYDALGDIGDLAAIEKMVGRWIKNRKLERK